MPLMQHPISEAERLERAQVVACELLECVFRQRRHLGATQAQLAAAIEADDGAQIERLTAEISATERTIYHLCEHIAELGGGARLKEFESTTRSNATCN